MSTINHPKREISCKLVYYGPGMSGKTTNLKAIYARVPSHLRGDMIYLDTEDERTLFFDFLPVELGEVQGFKTRFQIYTVPGQHFYNASRRLILRGVDGIIFVADSNPARLRANAESMRNLRENLAEKGVDISEIPIVLQINKRDLPDALPTDMIRRVLDPQGKLPFREATADKAIGVFETLRLASRLVLQSLRNKQM